MRKSKTTIAEAKANYERVYEITTLQYFKQRHRLFSGSLLAEKGPCRLCKQLKVIVKLWGRAVRDPLFKKSALFGQYRMLP